MTKAVSLEGGSRYTRALRVHLTYHIAREALVEALTHIDMDELQVAIQTLQHDKQSRFLPMLEISMSSRLCANDSDVCSAIEGLERCVTVVLRSVLLHLCYCCLQRGLLRCEGMFAINISCNAVDVSGYELLDAVL